MSTLTKGITRQRAHTLLTRLVRCPSVNPGHQNPCDAPYGEARLAAMLDAELRTLGADTYSEMVLPGRPNLWARIKGRDSSRTILFDAHTDTVSHLNMRNDPFAAELRNNRLYGRGACDTKGPMTAMLLAVEEAVREGTLAHDVIFAATCDEESGGRGVMRLIETGINADGAIVAEPTRLAIVRRHKGIQRALVTLRGVAAHSSTPQQGHNALYPAARLVTALAAMADTLAQDSADPELGSATLAVTTQHGGTASNIVPDLCRIEIDRRILPGESVVAVRTAIEALVHASCAMAPWSAPEITWTQQYPALHTPADSRIVTHLEKALLAVTGTAHSATAAFGTHAGFYARAGIPSLVFGPGSITDAHTRDESIDLDEVVTAGQILYRFLCTPLRERELPSHLSGAPCAV